MPFHRRRSVPGIRYRKVRWQRITCAVCGYEVRLDRPDEHNRCRVEAAKDAQRKEES
jgi:hypothetical protein